MRGTTVPRREQNKAFDEEIGQSGECVPTLLFAKKMLACDFLYLTIGVQLTV